MKSLFFLLFFIILPLFAQADVSYEDFCPNLKIIKNQDLDLTSVEKTLICGDQSIDEWTTIPLNQAKYHLEIVLQNQGYHFPKIKVIKNKIYLDKGKTSKIKMIELIGFPPDIAKLKNRNILNQPMTPSALNQLEDWLSFLLDLHGFPCVNLTTRAFSDLEKVVVITSLSNNSPIIDKITKNEIPNLNSKVPKRFYAFNEKDSYNGTKIFLTNQRIIESGIFQGSYFYKNSCSNEKVSLDHKIIDGPPKLIKIGLGVNSESLFTARAFWSNTRFGPTGSRLTAEILASKFKQQLELSGFWFFKPGDPIFAELTGRITKERNDPFDSLENEVFVGLGSQKEFSSQNLKGKAGVAYSDLEISSPFGPQKTSIFSFQTELQLTSNDFEINKTDPVKGYNLFLRTKSNDNFVISQFTAHQLHLKGSYLLPLDNYFPPKYVFGLRGSLSTTLVEDEVIDKDLLPATYRYFLGGSQNLRGFSRNSLPNSTGALTSLYLGMEQRFLDILPWSLQPLILFDFGKFGSKSLSFDSQDYYSYGLGLRWDSPVGVFRFTAAKGVIQNEDIDNDRDIQLYLSFGEEF